MIPIHACATTKEGLPVVAELDDTRDELCFGDVRVRLGLLRYARLKTTDKSLAVSDLGTYDSVKSDLATNTFRAYDKTKVQLHHPDRCGGSAA